MSERTSGCRTEKRDWGGRTVAYSFSGMGHWKNGK